MLKLLGLVALIVSLTPPLYSQTTQTIPFGLVIHGGAGTLKPENYTPERKAKYLDALTEVLEKGNAMLKAGRSAMDVVEECIWIMEDSPLFNSGHGAVMTHEGTIELDASIMDGKTLEAGAVTGIKRFKHPISVAKAVLEHSPHVMLAGDGAEAFARQQELEEVDPSYFRIGRRERQLKRAIEKEKIQLDHDGDQGWVPGEEQDYKYGTVGVVVLDKEGNLAAGTSTGGMTNKRYGRIGDTPVIGAGTYANNASCAISCTGHGEFFIRQVVAYDIAARMTYLGSTLQEAAMVVVLEDLKQAGGNGGIIGIDKNGEIATVFNTPGMYRGYFRSVDSQPSVAIFK